MLGLAWQAIEQGVQHGSAPHLATGDYPGLQAPGACFVTLHRHGELRGCIGSLQAYRPLVQDVVENAYAAAFRDPRFAPLSASELDGLELHISVLSAPQPLVFDDEADLLRQLRPGVDGLIIEETPHRATFLPSVWDSLPEKRDFLRQLKLKAGLPADYWSERLSAWRYTTQSFE